MEYFALGQKVTRTGSWAWNPTSGELFWSREHFRILGLDPENNKASYHVFFRMIHTDEMATIAHEVNQPLAALGANAGAAPRWLAGDPPCIDKARQALTRIARDANQASSVIARIRALVGGTDVQRVPLDLKFDRSRGDCVDENGSAPK